MLINLDPPRITDSPTVYAEKGQQFMTDLVIWSDQLNGFYDKVFIVQEQKSLGVGGGNSSIGLNNRDLNTIVANTIDDANLSGSYVILPAGTYYLEASAPAYSSGAHKLQIVAGADQFWGTSEITASGGQSRSFAKAKVTFVGASNSVYLRHAIATAIPTTGLGYPTNFVGVEIYAELKITKV